MPNSSTPARRSGTRRGSARDRDESTHDRGSDGGGRPGAEERERALRRLDRFARVLDASVRVPFTPLRFGIDGVVGLVPVVGDAASAAISLYPIAEARRLGFRTPTLLRMLGNVVVDAAVGAIPVVGDLFDFGFKANLRNVELLRRRLRDG